jgi:Raf kinase inhibitor-like YbhB/YbcL family protein
MTNLPGGPRFTRTRRTTAVPFLAPIVLAVAILLLAGACGTSGRAMQTPVPGATGPTRRPDVTTTTVAGANTLVTTSLFTVTSSAFAPGAQLPKASTCDGAGTALPFTWANVPAGTVELALAVTDPDADNYVHWFVTGIDPTLSALVPGALPKGAVELASTAGTATYAPPCPPAGETHTYDITLYALSTKSGLTAASPTQDALVQVASGAKGTAVLTGDYTRASAN